MTDQPALGPDGRLLDASKIVWFNDPDDPHPIQPTSDAQRGMVFKCINPQVTTKLVLTDFFCI